MYRLTNLMAVKLFMDHDFGDTPACQDATCAACGEFVEGFGCSSDAPICKDGVCIYCGEAIAATVECEADENGLCIYCEEDLSGAAILYGDANGDGTVDNKDVSRLQQYLAEWEVVLDPSKD